MNMNNSETIKNETVKNGRDANNSNNSGNRRTTREQRNAWKLERAKEPDSLVIKVSSERVVALTNLLVQTDFVMRKLQNRVGISINVKEAEKVFDEWNQIVLNIDSFTEKYSELTDSRYIESNAIKRLKNMLAGNNDTVVENKNKDNAPAPVSSDKKIKGG